MKTKWMLCGLMMVGCGGAPGDEGALELDEGTSAIAAGPVLALLNGPGITEAFLDDEVGLDRRAAESIVSHLFGRDGRRGTADDGRLDTIEALDALPYVGASALRALDAYARAHPPAAELIVDGVALTAEQAQTIVRGVNDASLEALDVDADLDSRAARALYERRPYADVLMLAAVPYVGKQAIEKLLAWVTRVPPQLNPEIITFTVGSDDGSEIVLEWTTRNAATCTLGAHTIVNRRRTEVLSRQGAPASSSLAIVWPEHYGDSVDAELTCFSDGRSVGAARNITRARPGLPPPVTVDCSSLRGGSFDGVAFSAAEECTAVRMLDEARYSDMARMPEIARRTAYDCTPDGRCSRDVGRRSRWTSLAQFAAFPGIAQASMTGVRAAVQSGWAPGGPSSDTIADLWARRRTLTDAPIHVDRAYVTARTRDQLGGTFTSVCVEVRDAPGAASYMTACLRAVGADSAAGCTGNPAACLDPLPGQWVSLRGTLNAAREAPGGYRIQLTAEGPRPAAGAPAAAPFAVRTGQMVDLEGTQSELMRVDMTIAARAHATPSELSTFVAAYMVPVSNAEGVLGAAFAHALDVQDWLTSDNVAVSAIDLARLGDVLADRLDVHAPGSDPGARARYVELGRAMAAGASRGYLVAYEDSGDASYVAVATLDRATGELRFLGFRRDP